MYKYKKAFHEIEKILNSDSYSIIILLGLRKTGKTTILQQLAGKYGGYYEDFRDLKNPVEQYLALFDRKEKFIFLDEIGYLPQFDSFLGSIEHDAANVGKKVVITSSSYGTLKQIIGEKLGARAYIAELFPLDFEEYLYFSGKISKYDEIYDPMARDIQDFYRLKDIPEDMRFIIDRNYIFATFHDAEVAHANQLNAVRDVILSRDQYVSVLDVIAYTLNEHISMQRFTGMRIGSQEFGAEIRGIPMSATLIGLANKIVNKMANRIVGNIDISDLAHIIAYLFYSGFLFIDLKINENGRQKADTVINDLLFVKSFADFEKIIKDYTFSVISPLLYTRLLIDMEDIVGKFYSNPSLTGQLYELTVKSESVYRNKYNDYHISYKYSNGLTEVDLLDRDLFLEATIGEKKADQYFVDKVLQDTQLIRVLTDKPDIFEDTDIFYKIGYPKALLMLSNGSIYKLNARKRGISEGKN